MDNLAKSLVNLFDVITDTTGVDTKDKKGNYFDIKQILANLSEIWQYLDNSQKNAISEVFVESFINHDINKIQYDQLSKKIKKLPLIAFISPEAEDTQKLHIIYDRINRIFLLSDKATKDNLMSCWHFKPIFDNIDDIFNLLKSVSNQIKGQTYIRDFLLQNIKVEEIYFSV